jgi:hypothetical protein
MTRSFFAGARSIAPPQGIAHIADDYSQVRADPPGGALGCLEAACLPEKRYLCKYPFLCKKSASFDELSGEGDT